MIGRRTRSMQPCCRYQPALTCGANPRCHGSLSPATTREATVRVPHAFRGPRGIRLPLRTSTLASGLPPTAAPTTL